MFLVVFVYHSRRYQLEVERATNPWKSNANNHRDSLYNPCTIEMHFWSTVHIYFTGFFLPSNCSRNRQGFLESLPRFALHHRRKTVCYKGYWKGSCSRMHTFFFWELSGHIKNKFNKLCVWTVCMAIFAKAHYLIIKKMFKQ